MGSHWELFETEEASQLDIGSGSINKMRKVKLVPIPEDIYPEVGKLTLFFSHVEWLIANVLLLGKMSPHLKRLALSFFPVTAKL